VTENQQDVNLTSNGKICRSIEQLARNFDRVFGTGLEKSAAEIADMTLEQRREHNRRVRAGYDAVKEITLAEKFTA